ncbi:MAG: putative urea ABC transporter substrate-binding protein [Gammaproteobacteria bacterium]|nr:putative urea ABC transporter substrate-binding protein [Gammaproteobacteria bacterium]
MKFRAAIIAVMLTSLCLTSTSALAKDHYKVAWSIYVGWMPWGFAKDSGIVDKWAKKYGITIDVVQFNDYVESINQYTAGAFDACAMTNMDAMTIPAAGGVDSTALIVGDFSNGNDGILLKGAGKSLADIKGQRVNLVELSVSHYVLARGLASAGMSERDVKVVNTSDADIVAAFASNDVTSVVTWNPLLSEIEAMPAVSKVFDSASIPGEIIDMLVVNSATLEADPRLGKALSGAWYETMALMAGDDDAAKAAKSQMAAASGTDLAGFNAQLDATRMFYDAAAAAKFARSADIITTMKNVAEFSFAHGLLGDGAPDSGYIGVEFPGGVVAGSKTNVKLRFNATYMDMAAQGKL